MLRPRGSLAAADAADLRSPAGWTRFQVTWRIIELWNVPASSLLEAGDVGLLPWVPLSQFDGPPEPLFRICRDRIDREADDAERANLFAVSQVLAGLRYDDESLIHLLGGRKAMIESPVLQKLKKEWTEEAASKAAHEARVQYITRILNSRFGSCPRAIQSKLNATRDGSLLDRFLDMAVSCPTLEQFRAFLRKQGGHA